MKDKIEPGEPAIGFSLDMKINDRRALVAQSYVPIHASKKEINALMDRMVQAADRLDLIYRIKDLTLLLEKATQELPLHEKAAEKFDNDALRTHRETNRKSDFDIESLKGGQRQQRDNLIQNVAMARVNIDRISKAIEEAKAELEAWDKE